MRRRGIGTPHRFTPSTAALKAAVSGDDSEIDGDDRDHRIEQKTTFPPSCPVAPP